MSKTDKIATRLRAALAPYDHDFIAILNERERLRAALEPFACKCETFCTAFPVIQNPTEKCRFRGARAALESEP